MIWWITLLCIIVPLIFVGVVSKAEVTFSCLNCGRSITIRHYAVKQVTCNKCGKAHYTLYAWGKQVQRVEYHIMALSETQPPCHGIIPGSDLTVAVDKTEVADE